MQEETVNAGSQYGEVARCMYAGGVAPGKRLRSTKNWRVCLKRRPLRGEYEEDGQRGTDLETTNVFEAGTNAAHGLQVWPRTIAGATTDTPCLENYYSLAGISIFGESSGNARMKLTHAVWGRTNFQHTGGDTIFAGEDVFWMWPAKLWRGAGEPAPDDGTEGDNFIRTMGRAEFDAERVMRRQKLVIVAARIMSEDFCRRSGLEAINKVKALMPADVEGEIGEEVLLAMIAAVRGRADDRADAFRDNVLITDTVSAAIGRLEDVGDRPFALQAALRIFGQRETAAAQMRGEDDIVRAAINRLIELGQGSVAGGRTTAQYRADVEAVAAGDINGDINAAHAARRGRINGDGRNAYNADLVACGFGMLPAGAIDVASAEAFSLGVAAVCDRLDSPEYRKRHYLGRCMLGAEPGRIGAVLLGI